MTEHHRLAVACYWAPYLVLVLVGQDGVIALENPRCRRGGVNSERLVTLLARFVARHGAERVVVDPRTARYLGATRSASAITMLKLGEAAALLFNGATCRSHRELYTRLLDVYPELGRFAARPARGPVLLSEYWPTARLFAIALGLAAQRAIAAGSQQFHPSNQSL